jgi:SnoaL-like domain
MAGEVTDQNCTAQSADAASLSQLQTLLARVTRLEDERAILDALHRYGQAADDGDDRAWSNLFVENGVFLCLDRDENVVLREQGHPALAQWLRNFRANEVRLTKHCVLAPVIRIEGERALVKSYLTRISENADPYAPPFLLLMGKYRDEMIKEGDGQWRFTQRTALTDAPLRAPPSPGAR